MTTPALFPAIYVVPDDELDELPAELTRRAHPFACRSWPTSDEALLGAAAVLERSVNNTSVYFVLDVAGTRLLFVGDSQEGAWEHVLGDEASRELVSNVAFYKIGHHGSHNATPKSFVESVLGDGAYAMLPWGLVKKWADTIPKAELLAALAEHKTHVIRADAPVADTPQIEIGSGPAVESGDVHGAVGEAGARLGGRPVGVSQVGSAHWRSASGAARTPPPSMRARTLEWSTASAGIGRVRSMKIL